MSALTDALPVAQARALAAIQKAYLAHRVDRETAGEEMIVAGCIDEVDREALLNALDIIERYGAPAPAEQQQKPDRSVPTQAQRDYIAKLSREREIDWTDDLPGLDRDRASELINQLKAGTARKEDWDIPFR